MYGSNDEDGDEDEYEDGVWTRFDLSLNHMVTIELRLHQLVATETRTAMTFDHLGLIFANTLNIL